MPKPAASSRNAPALTITPGAGGRPRVGHDWDLAPAAARALQTSLRSHITVTPLAASITRVAGVDIGFEDRGATTRAAVVVFDVATREIIDQALAREPTRMPYVPGLLSFREVPAALTALDTLDASPDLLMVDGHGMAHPRRLGVATHLGLASGCPAIGVAKKRLTGDHADVPDERGAWVALSDGDDTIGAVLRSRVGVKPIYVSVGTGITLAESLAWTRHFLTRYRLPETTRAADRLASRRG